MKPASINPVRTHGRVIRHPLIRPPKAQNQQADPAPRQAESTASKWQQKPAGRQAAATGGRWDPRIYNPQACNPAWRRYVQYMRHPSVVHRF